MIILSLNELTLFGSYLNSYWFIRLMGATDVTGKFIKIKRTHCATRALIAVFLELKQRENIQISHCDLDCLKRKPRIKRRIKLVALHLIKVRRWVLLSLPSSIMTSQ